MRGRLHFKRPNACTEEELREFAGLIRLGFDGSDERLEDRIRRARRLALACIKGNNLAAVAALKVPGRSYVGEVFHKARTGLSPAGYDFELGWVFVLPSHRGQGIGERLCRRLLEGEPGTAVFATTRPDNGTMIKILLRLGFAPTGNPFLRRDQLLALYIRDSDSKSEALV